MDHKGIADLWTKTSNPVPLQCNYTSWCVNGYTVMFSEKMWYWVGSGSWSRCESRWSNTTVNINMIMDKIVQHQAVAHKLSTVINIRTSRLVCAGVHTANLSDIPHLSMCCVSSLWLKVNMRWGGKKCSGVGGRSICPHHYTQERKSNINNTCNLYIMLYEL